MRRPQFTLKTMLWLMALVGAFFGGMALQASRASQREQELDRRNRGLADEIQNMVLLRGRLHRKLERMSKKLSDAGIDSGEIDPGHHWELLQ